MNIKKNYTTVFLACCAFTIIVSGCLKKDPLSKITQVLLVPLSPNAPPVDFSINGTIYATTVAYTTQTAATFTPTVRYTLPYYTLEPKDASVIAYNITGTTTVLASITKTLEEDKAYSSFLIDSVSKAKAVVVNDDLTDPSVGKVKIRFFHFSANTVPVNVKITGATDTIFKSRSFNDQVATPDYEKFVEINPGTYTFVFTNATTGATIYTTSAQSLLTDRIYTLALRGFTGGTGTQAIGAWVYPNKP